MTTLVLPTHPRLFAGPAEVRRFDVARSAEFDQFFLDNFDHLVRSVTAISGDAETARDCVQEAFVRAYGRWRRVRRYDNPAAWVRRVAINLCRDAARSNTRRVKREERVHERAVVGPPMPQERVAGELHVSELLAGLPPRQRAVAALFYIEDLSVAEIAESLSISAGAVKFHLNKAREGLRQAPSIDGGDA